MVARLAPRPAAAIEIGGRPVEPMPCGMSETDWSNLVSDAARGGRLAGPPAIALLVAGYIGRAVLEQAGRRVARWGAMRPRRFSAGQDSTTADLEEPTFVILH